MSKAIVDMVIAELKKRGEWEQVEQQFKEHEEVWKEFSEAEGGKNFYELAEHYDQFLNKDYKKVVQKLGIAHTPIEIVDFMIMSVQHILKKDFDTDMGSDEVEILDPFLGTGTFIVRIIQLEIMTPQQLIAKYFSKQMHACEILPLSYFIAMVNIAKAYAKATKKQPAPMPGLELTDTFQKYEDNDLLNM